MDEVPNQPSVSPVPSSKKRFPKNILIASAIVLLLLGFGGFWYKTKTSVIPTPTPTPEVTSTPEPLLTPTTTPTPTKKPTPKPTPTPTAVPTVTPAPTSASQTKTLGSTASLDGFQSSNGGGNSGVEVRAGRNVNLVTRGFVSFDLSTIPSGATIEQATLRLYQTSVIGDPYGVGGGSIKVDHMDYGSSFENSDYGMSALSTSFGTLSSNATVGWKELDVADSVRNDLTSSRSRSQYRIHLVVEATGGDVTGDFAYFEAAENSVGTGNTPQLVIRYH